MSSRFKTVLLIRFLSNLTVIVAVLSLSFEFGPVLGSELQYRKNQILGIKYSLDGSTSEESGPTSEVSRNTWDGGPERSRRDSSGVSLRASRGFGSFLSLTPQSITPVDPNFGIVIEKINANARIVPDVDPGDEKQYARALAQGVAAVKGSTLPGEPGNLYVFSHSTDAPWNIIRFNAIFYLLRELDKGDRVVVFYKGRRFDYIVYDKQITSPTNLDFLKNRYDQPVLTLQTCDPPGTLLNRLVVLAKLEGY